MMKRIKYDELTEVSREYTDYHVRVFSLDFGISDEPFGYFFVDNSASTLVWNGTVDFSSFLLRALQEIPYQILKKRLGYSEIAEATTVSFILSPNKLVEYELKYPAFMREYERIFEDPSDILFARYDMHGNLVLPFDYSFTAENPLALNSEQGELAIRLPNPEDWTQTLWTPALLKWIIHHTINPALARQVNWKHGSAMLEYLSNLVGKPQFA